MTRKAQAENDMTKTLVAVVLVFMVCQIMNPIRRIMVAVIPKNGRGCGSPYFYFTYLTSLAMAIDASSHFFIYSRCNKHFVEKLLQKVRRLAYRSRVTPAVEQQAAGGPAVIDAQRTPRNIVKLTPRPAVN